MRETRGFGWRGVTCCGDVSDLFETSSFDVAVGADEVQMGETYVASIEANDQARLLLDFLGHVCDVALVDTALGTIKSVATSSADLESEEGDGRSRKCVLGVAASGDNVTCCAAARASEMQERNRASASWSCRRPLMRTRI